MRTLWEWNVWTFIRSRKTMEDEGGKKRRSFCNYLYPVRRASSSSGGAIERNCARRTRETGNFTMQIQLPWPGLFAVSLMAVLLMTVEKAFSRCSSKKPERSGRVCRVTRFPLRIRDFLTASDAAFFAPDYCEKFCEKRPLRLVFLFSFSFLFSSPVWLAAAFGKKRR